MNWRRFFTPALPSIELHQSPIVLRSVVDTDFEVWAGAMARDEAYFRPVQPTWPDDHLSEAAFMRRSRLYHEERRRGTGFAFHIFHGQENTFIGSLRLADVRLGAARSGRLGYWIGQPYWGRGYATASVQAILAFSIEHLGLARIEAHCLASNHASVRVLEKSGFLVEGILRGYLEIDGKREDHLVFGYTAAHRLGITD